MPQKPRAKADFSLGKVKSSLHRVVYFIISSIKLNILFIPVKSNLLKAFVGGKANLCICLIWQVFIFLIFKFPFDMLVIQWKNWRFSKLGIWRVSLGAYWLSLNNFDSDSQNQVSIRVTWMTLTTQIARLTSSFIQQVLGRPHPPPIPPVPRIRNNFLGCTDVGSPGATFWEPLE